MLKKNGDINDQQMMGFFMAGNQEMEKNHVSSILTTNIQPKLIGIYMDIPSGNQTWQAISHC